MTLSKQIILLVICLSIFGLIMIGSSSVVDASRDFGDQWYYFKQQAIWLFLGFGALIFFSRFSHRRLQNISNLLLFLTIGMLIAVLIPGIGTKLLGARRWINFGLFVIQPAELAKLTLAIFMSALFAKSHKLGLVLLLLFGCLGLIVAEPDLGTALVIVGMGLLTFFGSGGRFFKLAIISVLGLVLTFIFILVSPYRLSRIKSFINSGTDPLGSSYQVRQAMIALGSGGYWGLGLGQSRQKYDFLPESTTDSIFAIIGEEMGILGTGLLLITYLTLIIRGFEVAQIATSPFFFFFSIAITSAVCLQVFINISPITSLFPLTGIPLTFISYGGSSLVVMLSATGILINIAKSYA